MKAQLEHHLVVNEKELRLILSALGKMPFEEVYELIEKLVVQNAQAQKIVPKIKK